MKAIACNLRVETKIFRKRAAAFVTLLNPGNGNNRIQIWGRSLSGRMVRKWEPLSNLMNFRVVTPNAKVHLWECDSNLIARALNEASDRDFINRLLDHPDSSWARNVP